MTQLNDEEDGMAMRRSKIVVLTAGVILLALAPITAFVVAPKLTRLPANTDLSFDYAGTATLLNAQALKSGDNAHAFVANVPVKISRNVKVTSTTADVAVAQDSLTLTAGGVSSPSKRIYAVDRSTLMTVAPPAGVKVAPTTGCLAIGLPIGPKANSSYPLYDASTQKCFPLKYTGTQTVSGRTAYAYRSDAVGPVTDPATLATLPPALPKATLSGLVTALPADVQAKLRPVLPTLPDAVPLSYTAVNTVQVVVDRQTGIPFSQVLDQKVIAAIPNGGQTVDLAPVLAVNAHLTPKAQADLRDMAASSGRLLTLLTVVTPLVLAIIGLALIAFALLRRRQPGTEPASSQRTSADIR